MANTLTFANDTLTDANIYGGINYICDLNTGDEFSIGNTASASVSFVTDVQLPIYTKDAVNGTFVWEQDSVARGRFYITEVTRDKDKYAVTAYDAMILLETSISVLSFSFPVTVSAAASAIATYLGCTISGTIYNGTMAADSIEGTTTIRKVLGWVAEASGCSVKIDGSDHLCFMYYADSGITVSASEYKEDGLNVADYACAAIDNVTILDMAGMTHATAGSGTNSLFIIGNPFMYDATNTEAATILSLVEDFEYAPFTCEMFEENGLEVGTIATFGVTETLVMHIESGEDGAVASAVGSDSRAELNKSLDIIVNEALAVASDAQQTAQELNLHFWYTASGSEAGAHIAEVDKPTFEDNPSGGNMLSTSSGIAVRDGLTELATFGAGGSQIGKSDEAHLEMDFNSLQLKDSDGTAYFVAEDARDADGYVTITHNFTMGGGAVAGVVVDYPVSSVVSVTYNGDAVDYSFEPDTTSVVPLNSQGNPIIFTQGDEVVIVYKTAGDLFKSFTFGNRSSNDYGKLTFAEGKDVQASGDFSHAQNLGTVALAKAQTVLGTYNKLDPMSYSKHPISDDDSYSWYALIIGNGTDNNRSNAFGFTWDGNIEMYLDNTNDYDLISAINALGWQNDVIV